MHLAAEKGKHLRLKKLLSGNINAKDTSGSTPLLLASRNGHTRCVTMLLNAKADVNSESKTLMTPLLTAAEECHLEVVKVLLEAKANVDHLDDQRYSAVNLACTKPAGHPIVAALLAAGAKVDFPRAPVSPLGTAISYNCSDAVPLLIAARADVNYVGPKLLSPLGTAAFHHDLDAAALLLDARADPDLHGPSGQPAPPLESAALTGSVAMVRLLLARGADPSLRAPGFVPPLQLAARGDALFPTRGETFDHPNFVRLRGLPRDPLGVLKALLEAKADVAARDPAGGCTALIVATGEGFAPGVEALIAAGADVKGAEGAAALSFAAERGRAGCVRALLAAGVPADTVAGDGRTPLTVAVMRDDAEVARALIAARADVNRAHKGVSLLELSAAGGGAVSAALRHAGARSLFHQLLQRSALMRALCSGDREGAMRLVPSSSAEELEAALLHAAHHADEAMVTATLRAGAGPSCVSGGVTPLLAASRRGHAGVVRVLLERRADVGARPGVSGQTALQGAAAGRHREVVALLLARSNEVKREQTRGGK